MGCVGSFAITIVLSVAYRTGRHRCPNRSHRDGIIALYRQFGIRDVQGGKLARHGKDDDYQLIYSLHEN